MKPLLHCLLISVATAVCSIAISGYGEASDATTQGHTAVAHAHDATVQSQAARMLASLKSVPAKAVPDVVIWWSVPPRLDKSWAAWHDDTYDLNYIYPPGWPVVVDLCSSTDAGTSIQGYELSVQSLTIDYQLSQRISGCKSRFEVPELGQYIVSARMKTSDGWTASRSRFIDVKDWVVVILGDSMSSGEGNPDSPGVYRLHASKDLIAADTLRPAMWHDVRCHRSRFAGAVVAAKKLEQRDPHSSVTLIDLACSGAGIMAGLLGGYKGEVPRPRGTDAPGELTYRGGVHALIRRSGGAKPAPGTGADTQPAPRRVRSTSIGVAESAPANWEQ